jgi:hypothetical protein
MKILRSNTVICAATVMAGAGVFYIIEIGFGWPLWITVLGKAPFVRASLYSRYKVELKDK